MFNESWRKYSAVCDWLRERQLQDAGSMISNRHYTARNYYRVALRYSRVFNSTDSIRRNGIRVAQHTLANERKNWCDTHDSRTNCRAKLSRDGACSYLSRSPETFHERMFDPHRALRLIAVNQSNPRDKQWEKQRVADGYTKNNKKVKVKIMMTKTDQA